MRKYKKPVLFDDNMVMFEMENGWFYLVKKDLTEIKAFGHPLFYLRFNPYCKEANSESDVPKKTMDMAKELLSTLDVGPSIGALRQFMPFDKNKNPYTEKFSH